jgi:NADH dehydrogenase
MKRIVIVGAGFAGLKAAKVLSGKKGFKVTIIDRRNHHLFQPLLYQVATAGLSPADIAVPIRSLFNNKANIEVLKGEVTAIDKANKTLETSFGQVTFDSLILACGATHSYFGNDDWEEFAPGLKTLAQATEIRRRVLNAFELAENETDPSKRRKKLSFVVVGGGPTGVELAGAIAEMSRYTLIKDFRHINPTLTRVILVEAGPSILPSFSEKLRLHASRDLEKLGCQIWTNSMVTKIDADGVQLGDERIEASTVIWAAGVKASSLGQKLGVEIDRQGKIMVNQFCQLPEHEAIFIAGDMAHFNDEKFGVLPGIAPVASQQGQYIADYIIAQEKKGANSSIKPFIYNDKGQMATIGRSKAIVELPFLKFGGFIAWFAWLFIHIYYLTGFKNRFFVVFQWAWSYLTFNRGARLIVNREWRAKEN